MSKATRSGIAAASTAEQPDEALLKRKMAEDFERYGIPCSHELLERVFQEGFTYYDEFADLDIGILKFNLDLNLKTANLLCKTAIRERQHIQPILQRIGELEPLDPRLVAPIRDGLSVQKIARLVDSLTDLDSIKLYEHRHGSYVKLGEDDNRRVTYLVQHQRVIYFWDLSKPYTSTPMPADATFGDIANPAPYSEAFEALQRITGEKLTMSHRRHLEGFEYASLRQMLRKNELELKDCRELVARLNQTIKTYTAQSLWSSTRMILLDRISHRNSGVSLHCVLYPESSGTVVKVAKTGPEHIIEKEWKTCQEIHERVEVPSLVKFETMTQGRVNSEVSSESRYIVVMPYYGPLSQLQRMKVDFGTQFETTILRIMSSVIAAAWGCAIAGYYHGDIKPGNIVLPTEQTSKAAAILIDLGSAIAIGDELMRRTPEWGLGVAGGVEYDKACLATSTLALMYAHWQPDDLDSITPKGALKYVKDTVPEASVLHDILVRILQMESYETIWEAVERADGLDSLLRDVKPVLKTGLSSSQD